jgi:hypothetical protein
LCLSRWPRSLRPCNTARGGLAIVGHPGLPMAQPLRFMNDARLFLSGDLASEFICLGLLKYLGPSILFFIETLKSTHPAPHWTRQRSLNITVDSKCVAVPFCWSYRTHGYMKKVKYALPSSKLGSYLYHFTSGPLHEIGPRSFVKTKLDCSFVSCIQHFDEIGPALWQRCGARVCDNMSP